MLNMSNVLIAFTAWVEPVRFFIQMGTDDVVVYPRYIMIFWAAAKVRWIS